VKFPPALRQFLAPAVVCPPAAPRPAGGLYLGWGSQGPVLAGPEQGALVLGPPRSGKTTRLLAPAVLNHRTLNLPDGVEELRWSPVVGCQVWDEAVARAYALASSARPQPSAHDAHWVERAQALLAPLLHAAALSGADLAVVLSWLECRELVAAVSTLEDHRSHRAANLLQGIAHTDGRELSGIFSTADGLLAAYRTDAALGATLFANFDAEAFASSNDTVYICAPGVTQSLHAPLVVALLDQVRSAVYRKCPQPAMLFALDELAHVAPLPDLASTVAEGGSQGLVVMACLQDLSQARARWGTAADGFLTLFSHKLALPGIADLATLKAISALAGEVDVQVSSVTRGALPRQASTTWSLRRQPRLPIDAVASGVPGCALLVSGTHLGLVWLPTPPLCRQSAVTGQSSNA